MDEHTMNKDGDRNKDHMINNEGGNKDEIKEHRI